MLCYHFAFLASPSKMQRAGPRHAKWALCTVQHILKGKGFFSTSPISASFQDHFPPEHIIEPPIPAYQERTNEPTQLKRARLLYQSRKRGMLENGLLLGSFAAKHLNSMSEQHLQQYDRLINLPSNDWDLFYWATGVKPTPAEFETEVMSLLKEHVRNKDRESRIVQPELN